MSIERPDYSGVHCFPGTVRERAAELLLSGMSPLQVASAMKKDLVDVKRHLLTQVGEGGLRLSDILFSIPSKRREQYEAICQQHQGKGYWELRPIFRKRSIDEAEYRLYLACRRSERADMYIYLSDIEITLHAVIRFVFQKIYGEEEWWRKGVPEGIRVECVTTRERDPEPCSGPFEYTTFIHIKEIIDKNWGVFSRILPADIAKDKKGLLQKLSRLNRLRNGVMHPIKQIPIGDDEFAPVKQFSQEFSIDKWQWSGLTDPCT